MLPTLEIRLSHGLAISRIVGPELTALPTPTNSRVPPSVFALRSAQMHEGFAVFLRISEDTPAHAATIQVVLRYHTTEGEYGVRWSHTCSHSRSAICMWIKCC